MVLLCSACTATPPPDQGAQDSANSDTSTTQEVITYRACSTAPPGALLPLPRAVPDDGDPVASAIAELVGGVDEREAALGCTSFFSHDTQDALLRVHRSEGGDTVLIEFRDLAGILPETPGVGSFLPPGIMAELTWTVFHFEDIEAVRFSFDGDESAFWAWLTGPGARVEVFTRSDWEQI